MAATRVSGYFKSFACLLALFALATSTQTWAFGQNKQRTHDFQWQIFETEHFEIFYYPEEETLAREASQYAEEAFEQVTQLLRYKPSDKTPLFLYRNQVEFQQTNITPSMIGTGTGGFTEAFKNRIALPSPSSPRELRQVIRHEFTHALQYDIIYGEGVRSFRVYKGYLMPEWLIEGMAEYAAQDWDTSADMVIRDAVMHDRLVPLTLMDGFEPLEDVFLAYKESQLAFNYIAEQYGEEKIGAILNKYKTQIALSQILRDTLGVGLGEFETNFLYWVRQKYWLQAHGRVSPETYGTPVKELPAAGRPLTVTDPAWSPDGRFLAFVADYDQTFRIYLKPRNGDAPEAVTSKKFEAFSLAGHALAWSPDARQIAFVARAEGKTALYFLKLPDGSLTSQTLPCDDFFSPAWSPDGKKIALVAVNAGNSDIAVWDLHEKTIHYLTHDRWADNAPAWSPDGRSIVYVTERENFWQLARWTPENSQGPELLSHDQANHTTPSFSKQGGLLFYASDAGGISNLYQKDLATGEIKVLTNLTTGAFQPAPSPDGKKLSFSVYGQGSQNVMTENLESFQSKPFTPEPEKKTSEKDQGGVDTGALFQKNLVSQPYTFRFSPDLLFLLAGYDSSQGFIGGGYLTASDYLGNHMVAFSSNWVPGYQTQTQLSYGNFMFPVDLLFTGLYQRNYYRLIDLETGTLTDEFNDQQILGALQLSKPFSLYDRMEFETALQNLQREHQNDVIQQRVTRFRLSLVHDSISWFDYEPANGFRHVLSALLSDQFFNSDLSFSILQLNAQAYHSLDFINPYLVFGARWVSAFSLGPEAPALMFSGIGVLPESGTLRGYRYGELLGTQIAALNVELRFPLARNVNYSLWPLDFMLVKDVQMVLFSDTGLISNNILQSDSSRLRNSVGLGFRLHTFLLGKQILTIRFDISKITNTASEPYYTWGFGQAF